MLNFKNPLLAALLFAAVTFFSNACKHDKIVLPPDPSPGDTTQVPTDTLDLTGWPCSADSAYFLDVLPILNSQCAQPGCHDAITHKEGLNYSTYAAVMASGNVKPGNPASSKLYKVITDNDPGDRMPPAPAAPLSSAQISLISKWIQQGAKNNWCNQNYGACNTVGITYANFVKPILDNRCLGCHASASTGGGILITNFGETKVLGQSGKLVGSVAHQYGFSAMPKNGAALTPCQVDKIKAWVAAGMPL